MYFAQEKGEYGDSFGIGGARANATKGLDVGENGEDVQASRHALFLSYIFPFRSRYHQGAFTVGIGSYGPTSSSVFCFQPYQTVG